MTTDAQGAEARWAKTPRERFIFGQGVRYGARIAAATERAKYTALVAVATEIANLPMLRGESGVGTTYTVTYKDTGAMDRLDAALRALAGQMEAERGGAR